jgi:hypothetical protein
MPKNKLHRVTTPPPQISDIFVNDNNNENDKEMALVHDNENDYCVEQKLNNNEKDCLRTE